MLKRLLLAPSGNAWLDCVTLTPSLASRPKMCPACARSSSPSSRPPWFTEGKPDENTTKAISSSYSAKLFTVIGLIMLGSFGPDLLSLELIIVCDCMFSSTVFSLAFWVGGKWDPPGQSPLVLLCIVIFNCTDNKILFQIVHGTVSFFFGTPWSLWVCWGGVWVEVGLKDLREISLPSHPLHTPILLFWDRLIL